jgi:predicted transposase YbfD/YdcC
MEKIREKFEEIADERHKGYIKHKLADILILVMCGILCGLKTLEENASYGKNKREFLNKSFGVENTASKSTLSRTLNMINGETTVPKVVEIMRDNAANIGNILAVDGKTIRSTIKGGNPYSALQILTAYMTESSIVLGQETVNEKTNEIPVFQEMLKYIDVTGKTVTADSLHCQTETCKKIIDGDGDYVIGLKENQKTLLEETVLFMSDPLNAEDIETYEAAPEKNSGRLEKRKCRKISDVSWLSMYKDWIGIKSIFSVERTTIAKDKTTNETSYYITSLDVPPERLLKVVREHWKIEAMHWLLDVVLGEDECRILSENGLKNMNIFKKLSLFFHKKAPIVADGKRTIKSSMFNALLNDDYLLEILNS